ncbi:MAG: GatB/YqeY domain-containing protein [Bacteroidia bacterium]|nr:GatB/YqeY domain-containing protein [Bacteroidia bacterium]
MALVNTINDDIKKAMLAKDAVALAALRAIKSAILLAQTDGSGKELDEAGELALLNRMVKQRKDSISVYEQQGRADLAAEEKAQLAVIEKFLPAQMSPEEIETLVRATISELGASGPKDMGRVMGALQPKTAGRADGKLLAETVKRVLGN